MPCLQLNFFVLICLYLAAFAHVSLQANDGTLSVKKDTAHTIDPTNEFQPANAGIDSRSQEDSLRKAIFQKSFDDVEIPESFKMGFYFFIGLSISAILFILVKFYRMRLSRAERKYGVHGDRTTQELTPLPMAVEDESDNDDHTLFDINREIRVS